jgi:hypothetical protein
MAPFAPWTKRLIEQASDGEFETLSKEVFLDIKKRIKTEPYRFLNRRQWSPNTLGYSQEGLTDNVSAGRAEMGGRLFGVVPEWVLGAGWEAMTHAPLLKPFWIGKGWQQRSAVEEYEHQRIYGRGFAQWEHPFETFVNPLMAETVGMNPVASAVRMGAMAGAFGRSGIDRAIGAITGSAIGMTSGLGISVSEAISGEQYIPEKSNKTIEMHMLFDTMSHIRGNASLLDFGEYSGKGFGMIPATERRLMRDLQQSQGREREMLLDMVPNRLGAVIAPGRYDRGDIVNKAEQEFYDSKFADVSYALDGNLPGEMVKAALLQRTSFSPYNFNMFPDVTQVGEIINESHNLDTVPAMNYQMNHVREASTYMYMNSFKAKTVIRQYDKEKRKEQILAMGY